MYILSEVASIVCDCTLSVVVELVPPSSSIPLGVMIGSASALILDVRGVGGLAGTPHWLWLGDLGLTFCFESA